MNFAPYIILLFSFGIIALHVKHYEKKLISIIVSAILFIGSIVLFGNYTNNVVKPGISNEGIPITFVMRLFMLDDHFTAENITTGFITSSCFLLLCVGFLVYNIIKYVKNNK